MLKKIVILLSSFIIIGSILYFSLPSLTSGERNKYTIISSDDIPSKIEIQEISVVYFFQNNCSSCKLVTPIINKYITSNNKKVYAIDINEDSNKNYITQELNIQGTPTVIFYKNGEEVDRFISVFTEIEFESMLDKI